LFNTDADAKPDLQFLLAGVTNVTPEDLIL